MGTGGYQTCGDIIVHLNAKSLGCTSEINVILYIIYISTKKNYVKKKMPNLNLSVRKTLDKYANRIQDHIKIYYAITKESLFPK